MSNINMLKISKVFLMVMIIIMAMVVRLMVSLE